jgi:hypothetical protein
VQAAAAAVSYAQNAAAAVTQVLNADPDQVPDEVITDDFCDSAVTYLDSFAKASGLIEQRWQTVERLNVQGRELEHAWISVADLASMRQRLAILSKRDEPQRRPDRLHTKVFQIFNTSS